MKTEFVGREAELALLADYLDEALDGRPRIAVCSGEPGIGKTRLAQELAELAVMREFMVVWGLAVDAVGVPPFWPWRQVMRALSVRADLKAIADKGGLSADLATTAPDASASSPRSSPTRRCAAHIATFVLRQPDGSEAVVVVTDADEALDRGREIIMNAQLLPGEDPALLPGPTRVERYQVVAATEHGVPLELVSAKASG